MNRLGFSSFLLALGLAGCSVNGAEYSAIGKDVLEAYRAAVPSERQLSVPVPAASVAAKVGDPAVFPARSREIVVGVNGAVTGIVDLMRAIVDLEPTLYKSDTKEFLWGPYPHQDGFGNVAAYIRDAGEDGEFRYQYALLRGASDDLEEMAPVIWGAATPDPDDKDHGAGITLWDFEANRAFEGDYNPDFSSLPLDRGRFVAVYGKDKSGEGEAALVVSAFRGFVPKNDPGAEPVDLDYFYGRFTDGQRTFDFVDWEGTVNVDEDPARHASESVSVRMAFLNEGAGRAEATASGGDLTAGQEARVIECWDSALAETYLSLTMSTSGAGDPGGSVGSATKCGVFKDPLAALGVPSLEDVDPALRAALDEAAKNGVPAK